MKINFVSKIKGDKVIFTDEYGKEWEYGNIEDVLDHIYIENDDFDLQPTKQGYIQVLSEDQAKIGTIS